MGQFGAWLRDERDKRRMSLRYIAKEAGCSATHLSNLERGIPKGLHGEEPRPSRHLVKNVATVLGASVADGLEAAGYKPEDDVPNITEMIAAKISPILLTIAPERRHRVVHVLEETARMLVEA